MAYESLALEYEAFNREGEKPEWFYIIASRWLISKLYAGPPQNTLQS